MILMIGVKAENGGRFTALDGLGGLSDSLPWVFLACASKCVSRLEVNLW